MVDKRCEIGTLADSYPPIQKKYRSGYSRNGYFFAMEKQIIPTYQTASFCKHFSAKHEQKEAFVCEKHPPVRGAPSAGF